MNAERKRRPRRGITKKPASLGAALGVLIVFALELAGVDTSSEFATAIVIVSTTAVGYLKN